MTQIPIPPTVAEISTTAIRVLCREIGPVNTARFLNQFTNGFGNYTGERDQLIGNPTVDELVAEIKSARSTSPQANPKKKRASRKPFTKALKKA